MNSSSMVAVLPAEETALSAKAESWISVAKVMASLVIQDAALLETAGTLLRHARAERGDIEAQRKASTKPIHDLKRRIDTSYKRPLDALDALVGQLESMIADYHRRNRIEREAAIESTQVTLAAGLVPTAVVPTAPKLEGISVRTVWQFDVADPELVPRNLCSPDLAKIKACIPVVGSPQEIPGVRWFQVEDVRARRS